MFTECSVSFLSYQPPSPFHSQPLALLMFNKFPRLMSVMPTLKRPRQEDCKFKVSLGKMLNLSQKKKMRKKGERNRAIADVKMLYLQAVFDFGRHALPITRKCNFKN